MTAFTFENKTRVLLIMFRIFPGQKRIPFLDKKIEQENEKGQKGEDEISFDFFFPPVNGTISQSFNPLKDHFGVDVVTFADETNKSLPWWYGHCRRLDSGWRKYSDYSAQQQFDLYLQTLFGNSKKSGW